MKRIKNIRIWNIIMVALILVLLLFCIGLFVRSTPDSREEKIISYLKGKYDSDFEIVELSFSGNVNLTDEVNFDGTVFFPEIKNIFVYCYEYEVLSKIDNVTFSVSYLDGVFFDDVIENPSYYSIIYTSSACEDIRNYATYVMGDAKSDISSGGVTLEFDETFDEAYSKDYKKKLKKVRKYIKKINGQDKDMDILVYFKYSDNILIYLGNDKFTVTKRSSEYFEGNQGQDIMTGEYMRMYSSLDEYLKDNR